MSVKKSAESEKSVPRSAKTRRKPDWAAVERDYRTGKFTLQELEDKHGADTGLTARNARKHGWTRDLSVAIRQATDAKLVKTVAKGIEAGPAQEHMDAAVVSIAAEINKDIILSHRRVAQRALEAMRQAQDAVLKHGSAITDIREAAVFAGAVESLSRTAKNCIEIERRAYSLDDAPPPPPEKQGAADGTFQVVHEQIMAIVARHTTTYAENVK